jgi:hypothetical protein
MDWNSRKPAAGSLREDSGSKLTTVPRGLKSEPLRSFATALRSLRFSSNVWKSKRKGRKGIAKNRKVNLFEKAPQ